MRDDAALACSGPYRWIRHPMYSALLTGTIVPIFENPGWINSIFWFILLIDLLVKLRIEEGFLKKRFKDYQAYSEKTWRLIPLIY